MPDFTRLGFGAPAAERDIRSGLDSYFIESEAYRNVSAGAKRIIVGNRGAGKSAIFKTMAGRERDSGAAVVELAPEDYSYEFLSSSMVRESEGSWAKLGAYATAWKYLLLILIMKELTKRYGRLRRGAESQIYAYLRDHVVAGADNAFDAFVSYLRRIESIKIGSYEASIRTRELQSLYKLQEIAPLIPPIKRLCERQRVTILVDELDRGWDATEDAQIFVAGLFQACMWINDLSPNLRVYMSLRQELYDNIPAIYDDAQKFRDLIEVVTWNADGLWELIAGRIRHTVQGLERRSDDQCWGAVFSEPRRAFEHMTDRSLHRPRELIQYCSHALDYARQRKRPDALPITRRDIEAVEAMYSAERTRDIAAEYRFKYPGLLSVFGSFRDRPQEWRRSDLELFLLDLATGAMRTDPAAANWVDGREPDELVEILWGVGFLKAAAESGPLGAAGYPGAASHAVDRFSVHPMFRSYVGTLAAP